MKNKKESDGGLLIYACSRSLIVRSLKTSLFVGTLLNLINQWDGFFGNNIINWATVGLTFIVPYLVSTYAGATSAKLHAIQDNECPLETLASMTQEFHQHAVDDNHALQKNVVLVDELKRYLETDDKKQLAENIHILSNKTQHLVKSSATNIKLAQSTVQIANSLDQQR